MNNQTLDRFLSDRTAREMNRIEEKIYSEVSTGVCKYFNKDNLADLTEDQIREVKKAHEARERGFLKLGYNLVLKQLC